MNCNYYTAKVFGRNCVLCIQVNGIPMFRQAIEGDINFERPINQFIEKSGEQSVEIKISPLQSGLNSSMEIVFGLEVCCYDGSGPTLRSGYTVLKANSDGKENRQLIFTGIKKYVFNADVAYIVKRWSACEPIKIGSKIAPVVSRFMKDLFDIFATKQYDRYLKLIATREHNICKSLYLGEDEILKRNSMLLNILNDGFEIMPLEGHKRLQFYCHRRVIEVIGENMEPAIQFENPLTNEILSLEILLGFQYGKKELSII